MIKIKDLLTRAFSEGYATTQFSIADIMICMFITLVISAYIYWVYRQLTKNTFYNRNFNLSLIAMAVITAAIILTIQSNIVVSLGMVGALSIIRFRTAVKDPLDLVFLFWSISVGIICGAGFALIAIISSIIITIVVLMFNQVPASRGAMLLVVNASEYKVEKKIMKLVNKYSKHNKVKARNLTQNGLNMAVEVKTDYDSELLDEIMALEGITAVSLVDHEGDVTV